MEKKGEKREKKKNPQSVESWVIDRFSFHKISDAPFQNSPPNFSWNIVNLVFMFVNRWTDIAGQCCIDYISMK